MTGIVGWLGARAGKPPARQTVQDMATVAPLAEGMTHNVIAAADGHALAAAGWPEEIWPFTGDGIECVVYGSPDWPDATLAGIAREQGHGAALARGWRDRGTAVVEMLHGPAAAAIVDAGRNEALAAVDRAGIFQMCYAAARDGGMVFASDARAVCRHPGVETHIARQSLYDYLYFYISPAPRTVYEGVRKLAPGHFVHFANDAIKTTAYWEMSYGAHTDADPGALGEEMRHLLDVAVGNACDRAPSGEIGAFLSGGLDSTSVCGMLARRSPGPQCFTIAFPEERYNELPWAEAGARHFGIRHVTRVLTPDDALAAIPRIIEAHDEPYGNSSAVPALVCADVARESGIVTLLAGDGGDEIFAGNERYVEQGGYGRWESVPRALRLGVILPALQLVAPREGSGLFARARRYAERASMPLPDRLQGFNPVETSPPEAIFDRDFLAGVDPDEPRRLQRDIFHRLHDISPLQRMMFLDLQITLADNDLRKVGRACEAAGIRVRYPMLDEALMEFAARLPDSVLLSGGALRGFYKRAMDGFLPDEILNKSKHGFGMPFAEWTRAPGKLRDLAMESLGSFAGRHILSRSLVDGLRDDLSGGRPGTFGGMTWDIMMLERWMEKNAANASIR